MTKNIEIDPEIERAVLKLKLERDHLAFTRYFLKHREGSRFILNWHHYLISDTLEQIIQGTLKNVVINVPPGGTKTELVAINFMARGLALNPRARFLHISYSDELALGNSKKAKDIVMSDEYQELWPLNAAQDSRAVKRWNIMHGKRTAGGVYAVSLGGQITGFRAGQMQPGWQGALILDDVIKVSDSFSRIMREKTNRDLVSTVQNRRAHPDTPIVLIMQRVAQGDPTEFILEGGLVGEWEHVVIPALITDDYVSKLSPKYQKIIEADKLDAEKDDQGRFSYWPYKEPLERLLQMEKGSVENKEGQRVSRYVFYGQYMQNPTPIGGEIIKSQFFKRYKVLPKLRYKKIFADTAQKTKERNDFSVFECWGLGEDGKIYLVDLVRGKWEAPELKRRAIAFWQSHLPQGPHDVPLRQMCIEDKASGTGLIQDIQQSGSIPVYAIQRTTSDKLTRVMDVVSYIEAGLVCIPEEARFVSEFVVECEAFTADDSHSHDDQIDPMADAINDMLAKKKTLFDLL